MTNRIRQVVYWIVVAAIVLLMAGVFREDVGYYLWGAWRGQPVQWNGLSVSIPKDTYVASLPDNRILLVGSKQNQEYYLKVIWHDSLVTKDHPSCVLPSTSCSPQYESQATRLDNGISRMICRESTDKGFVDIVQYCVEGSHISMQLRGDAATLALFAPITDKIFQDTLKR